MIARLSTRPGSRGRHGFTLLELMVVIMIIGVVSTLGTTAFVTVTTAWNDQRALVELDAMAEEVFSAIERDLSDTLSHDLSGVVISGASRDAIDHRSVPAAHNADDTLIIPIQGAAEGRIRQQSGMVGYRVDRSATTQTLVRTKGGLNENFPATGSQPIVPGAQILAFRVEYLSTDSTKLWVKEWHGRSHPQAVRVSITLADLDRPDRQLSRKSVLRVHVR